MGTSVMSILCEIVWDGKKQRSDQDGDEGELLEYCIKQTFKLVIAASVVADEADVSRWR